MSVSLLGHENASALRSRSFSYDFVGALSSDQAPPGANELRRTTQLSGGTSMRSLGTS